MTEVSRQELLDFLAKIMGPEKHAEQLAQSACSHSIDNGFQKDELEVMTVFDFINSHLQEAADIGNSVLAVLLTFHYGVSAISGHDPIVNRIIMHKMIDYYFDNYPNKLQEIVTKCIAKHEDAK